jgi:hemoglobin
MKSRVYKTGAALALLIVLSGCAAWTSPPGASLYNRLGGEKAIRTVVSDFIDTVGGDRRIQSPKVQARLAEIDIGKLKMHVANQVCMATGGPCKYEGRNMKEAHANLGISGEEFGYVVDDLVRTLDKYRVGAREKDELLALLAPMKSDIVEVASSQ